MCLPGLHPQPSEGLFNPAMLWLLHRFSLFWEPDKSSHPALTLPLQQTAAPGLLSRGQMQFSLGLWRGGEAISIIAPSHQPQLVPRSLQEQQILGRFALVRYILLSIQDLKDEHFCLSSSNSCQCLLVTASFKAVSLTLLGNNWQHINCTRHVKV